MLDYLQIIILGIIQGTLEWLPVSSEGINSLIMINFFGAPPQTAIPVSIWLHVGTMFAAIIYFRKDLLSLAKNLPKYSPKKHTKLNNLTTFLILSTILTGAIGYTLTKTVLQNPPSPMYSTIFIGALLIITGFLQRNQSLYSTTTKNNPDLNDSIFVGVLQGFSALPGMSRSGVTLIALLRTGFSLKDAFRLSFLMSIPVIAGAQIGMGFMNLLNIDPMIAITGAIMSFIFGLISIKYLMDIAGKARFDIFCLILGSFTIVYALAIYL